MQTDCIIILAGNISFANVSLLKYNDFFLEYLYGIKLFTHVIQNFKPFFSSDLLISNSILKNTYVIFCSNFYIFCSDILFLFMIFFFACITKCGCIYVSKGSGYFKMHSPTVVFIQILQRLRYSVVIFKTVFKQY